MLALFLTLALTSTSLAETKKSKVEEADILRLDLLEAKIELAVRSLRDLESLKERMIKDLREKYKLVEGDEIDPKTLEIKRSKAGAKK